MSVLIENNFAFVPDTTNSYVKKFCDDFGLFLHECNKKTLLNLIDHISKFDFDKYEYIKGFDFFSLTDGTIVIIFSYEFDDISKRYYLKFEKN